MANKLSHKHIAFLDFGSFPGIAMFCVGFTYEEALSICKRKYKDWVAALEMMKDVFSEPNCGFASKRTVDGVEHFFLVITAKFDFTDTSHTTLAHEVIHLISYQFQGLFIDPIQENESFCYTFNHLMQQCYKVLRDL